MIIKERKAPIKLHKLDALRRRLPKTHPKQSLIEEELAKNKAGYQGEQSLDYYLSFLPSNYHILHDVRLQNQGHYFQMDTIIATPSFILILEIKNFAGTIYFDHIFNQLIRTIEGVEERFPDPLLQVNRQRNQLMKWLLANNYPAIPIETAVVISNPNTIIKASTNNPQFTSKIVHSEYLYHRVIEIKNNHKRDILTDKAIDKLSTSLTNAHVPSNPNIMQTLKIEEVELLKGVHCPSCLFIPMKRGGRKWICPSCKYTSNDAHMDTIKDYQLLLRPTITNKQLREFLSLSSVTTASSIIKSLNLDYYGENRGRTYKLQLIDN
ncbi:ribosomal protein L37AE/L43A [Salirhabdus euzebyi]|uniref:Ribosomal protein L37AE/L43A n=1 Tax=Salirhabdus euzebyi TaxID=394506 RepID=A0A841Q6D4_9BACI|nr:nuclease-related domain-containing protein [Salirhabdus euzebyi]MBB6453980.1 ribosomal protein L37AE/L43A [Salirhabdus euzebyi]